jgi:hypothetical protein
VRIRSQGSSAKKRIATSNVAPPHISSEKKPTWSIFSAIGIIASVRILVAIKDWCASLNVVSVILTGLLGGI